MRGEMMSDQQMMAKAVQFKIFGAASATVLEKIINEWLVAQADKKYSIAPRVVGNNWDIFSALIVYGESSEAF
jgi:hypothetical protein